jgi:hypothetical protein
MKPVPGVTESLLQQCNPSKQPTEEICPPNLFSRRFALKPAHPHG